MLFHSFLLGSWLGLFALEDRCSLLEERLDSLFEVVAAKGCPACALNGLKLVGAQGGSAAQAAELGLDDRNRQRRAAGDRSRELHRRRLEFLGAHKPVEQPETVGVFGR